MRKARIADEATSRLDIAATYARLGDVLETTDLAINYYELDPGDQFGYAVHRHGDQEEVFVILEGTVTFETMDDSLTVESGEVIRFARGEFQLGVNKGDEKVIAFALGAPRDSRELQHYIACETCGERTVHQLLPTDEGMPFQMECTVCETERALDPD